MTDSKRIGVVGVPGAWSSESLADAFAERTGERLLIDMGEVVLDTKRRAVLFGGVNLLDLDGIVIKKIGEFYSPQMLDRLEILRLVARSGVRAFSDPERILRLLDRLSCTITLQQAEIPMPPTVVTESLERATDAVVEFGTAVLKPLYSTKARGMQVLEATSRESVRRELHAFQEQGNPVLYLQKKLDLPGRDLGVVFLGGEYHSTYARVSGGEAWNTTIRAGGRYEPHEPLPETLEIAVKAQSLFGLDFTCVDVVELADGPVVFEVSAFGGFRGLSEAFGVDIAGIYSDYVLAQL